MRGPSYYRVLNDGVAFCVGTLSLVLGAAYPVQAVMAGSVPFPASQRVDLLYLLAEPYSRLYVQVDAVEGCEPKEQVISTIRSMLSRNCNKPGGIQVVRKNIIPRSSVKGLAETMVAVRHMQGPESRPGQAPAAYLYILFYDSRDLGASVTQRPRAPYVPTDYPCAVFVDIAYMRPYQDRLTPRLLTHELYHALGLVKVSSRGDENHCRSSSCLMYCSYSLDDCLYRRGDMRYSICSRCEQDLRRSRAASPNTWMSFQGPILVRREAGYWVGLLPSYVGLYFRPVTSQDWQTIVQASRNSGHRVKCIENSLICYDLTTFTNSATLLPRRNRILDYALEDPNPNVSRAAETLAQSVRNGNTRRTNF